MTEPKCITCGYPRSRHSLEVHICSTGFKLEDASPCTQESCEQAFYKAYPLEPWEIKANGIGVARAIQRTNMRRKWDGFKKAWEWRESEAPHFRGLETSS